VPRVEVEDSRVRLLVGLGNPGAEYVGTRHNVGFTVVERFARRAGAQWEGKDKWDAAIARAGDILLLKPLTFMNRSGHAVAGLARFYKIPSSGILVVLDDLALPLGRLRIRERGGPGGHNGLESVLASLGTEDVARLRVGIGVAPECGAVDYVLSRFFEEEKARADAMIERAADALKCVIDNGLVSAMNTFNKVEDLK
jgi:PTH1 family peptidyl-tRNA hydrolase